MSPSFYDAIFAAFAACTRGRSIAPSIEPITLGLICLASVSMVALGVLSTRGAVKDVLDVMDRLPPAPDKDDDRAAARKRALKDFKALLFRRCVPGLLLSGAWTFFLLYVAFLALYRIQF